MKALSFNTQYHRFLFIYLFDVFFSFLTILDTPDSSRRMGNSTSVLLTEVLAVSIYLILKMKRFVFAVLQSGIVDLIYILGDSEEQIILTGSNP